MHTIEAIEIPSIKEDVQIHGKLSMVVGRLILYKPSLYATGFWLALAFFGGQFTMDRLCLLILVLVLGLPVGGIASMPPAADVRERPRRHIFVISTHLWAPNAKFVRKVLRYKHSDDSAIS